jgi:glycolate oxidase FAD binding subunit
VDLTGVAPALGLDAARAADPSRYAIGGRAPRVAVRPATGDELSEALRAAARDGLAVVPWGGGTSVVLDAPPERYDAALDLTGLDRVIEYEPQDLTLTAECGVTMASLRATLAARGQELPIEGAHAERATLGGALAANTSGARRLRFGSPRDRLLGATFVLGDGTRARTGGKVVKNVAGFGIHRLLCGSRGALAAIATASLKLAPAPASRVALVYEASAAELVDAERWSSLPRLEPAAMTVLGAEAARAAGSATARDFAVIVGLEDDSAWVAEQERRIGSRLGAPANRRVGDDAAGLIQRLADVSDPPGSRVSLTTAWNSPSALGVLKDDPLARHVVFHVLAGRLHVFPEPSAAAGAVMSLTRSGFAAIDARGVGALEPAVPGLAAVGSIRSRIREALDPGHTWAFGPRWQRGD